MGGKMLTCVVLCLEHGFEPKYSIPQSSGFPCSEKWSLFVIILLDRRKLLKLCRLQQPPYFSTTTKKITKTQTPSRTASSPAALLLQENQKLFVGKYRYPGFLSIVIVMIKCGLVTFNTRLIVTPPLFFSPSNLQSSQVSSVWEVILSLFPSGGTEGH